jgi:hypothetical protein
MRRNAWLPNLSVSKVMLIGTSKAGTGPSPVPAGEELVRKGVPASPTIRVTPASSSNWRRRSVMRCGVKRSRSAAAISSVIRS